MSTRDVVELEQQGWRALSAGGDAATRFYDRVLDQRVVMVLPGGLVLDDRAEILASMSGPPWTSHHLEEQALLSPTDDVAVLVYRVTAQREGAPAYAADVTSTYVRRADGWKLVAHQQTPR